MIKKLADDEVKFKLAVSLHSAIDEIRSRIMPFSTNFPLTELRESLEYWYHKTKSKITYEYVVWKGINDDKASIDALVKFCKYVPCKVNLIEYNAIDDGDFQQASERRRPIRPPAPHQSGDDFRRRTIGDQFSMLRPRPARAF